MNRIRLGSVTLLFSVIIICVSVLAVLSISTAVADSAMAERFAQETETTYSLENDAQARISEIADVFAQYHGEAVDFLPEYAEVADENTVLFSVQNEKKIISVMLSIGDDYSLSVSSWKETPLWTEDNEINVLK